MLQRQHYVAKTLLQLHFSTLRQHCLTDFGDNFISNKLTMSKQSNVLCCENVVTTTLRLLGLFNSYQLFIMMATICFLFAKKLFVFIAPYIPQTFFQVKEICEEWLIVKNINRYIHVYVLFLVCACVCLHMRKFKTP